MRPLLEWLARLGVVLPDSSDCIPSERREEEEDEETKFGRRSERRKKDPRATGGDEELASSPMDPLVSEEADCDILCLSSQVSVSSRERRVITAEVNRDAARNVRSMPKAGE